MTKTKEHNVDDLMKELDDEKPEETLELCVRDVLDTISDDVLKHLR